MNVIGDRKYVQIPGDRVHELPPLLLKESRPDEALDDVVERAERIIDADWLLPDHLPADAKMERVLAQRRVGLAVNLAEQYSAFLSHWIWGESILEWIRQCEITFDSTASLRPLLKPDVWPHAGRSSFVSLLADKKASADEVDLESAVGYRLTFRQPPPIQFFSEKFLLFLNASMAANAYRTWSAASGDSTASLPPERFRFFVMGSQVREV
jgi:hypothetical protein